MKESVNCNVMIVRIADLNYINLKGPEGQHISLQLSEPQAAKVVSELEITTRNYDSKPATESVSRKQLQKSTDDTDL